METKKNRIQFTGINGEKLDIPYVDINEITKYLGMPRYIAFWLKDDGEKTEKFYARINEHKKVIDAMLFMGYKLPVMIVKTDI